LSLRAGERIGDYEVLGVLGAGGMGAVYQVRHLISNRIEAMKVLLPDLSSSPDLAERFFREIRVLASLSHPNIAFLHNALQIDNQLLMIMEHIDGDTLADMLRKGPVRQIRAVDIVVDVLAALEYAHSRGVVHRDVKPSNIMVGFDGIVKLLDFGIARGLNEASQLTQAGVPVGSMYYMAPEQLRAGIIDERADIYSAGVTLFEALTGRRPIRDASSPEVLRARLETIPEPPISIDPSISRELSDTVMKALAKEPALRYQSAGEFRSSLLAVRNGINTASKASSFSPPVIREESGTTSQISSQSAVFDQGQLEQLRKDLAQYVGPMAKVLVNRAAKTSRSWEELYGRLVAEIPPGEAREHFLANYSRITGE
jgi:serine/threonine-protein kinase